MYCKECLSLQSHSSQFVLDEKFPCNASKFAIFHIPIRNTVVAFSVFPFMQIYFFFHWNFSSSTNPEIGRSGLGWKDGIED